MRRSTKSGSAQARSPRSQLRPNFGSSRAAFAASSTRPRWALLAAARPQTNGFLARHVLDASGLGGGRRAAPRGILGAGSHRRGRRVGRSARGVGAVRRVPRPHDVGLRRAPRGIRRVGRADGRHHAAIQPTGDHPLEHEQDVPPRYVDDSRPCLADAIGVPESSTWRSTRGRV